MTQSDWNEIGVYTDGDMGRVWGAFSQVINLPTNCGLYGRPVNDLPETQDDDFDIMLFHGNFGTAFSDGFLRRVTNTPTISCYVTEQTKIDGKRVSKVSGLGWTVVRMPPGIL